jgi:hypothetical protein
MRNLLAFVAAALLTFVGLGWYLDWYKVTSGAASGGHRQVNIDINTDKIGEDFEKGGKEVRKLLDRSGKNEDAGPADKKPEGDGSAGPAKPESEKPVEPNKTRISLPPRK